MRWFDGKADFGWISIGLHWLGAAAVLSLLFIGNSIQVTDGPARDDMLRLHTTLGLAAYLLLWARVAWRVAKGHPGPSPRQKRVYHVMGMWLHHLLVAAIVVMLLTGPLMAWAGDLPLRLGDLAIPSPFGTAPELFTVLRWGHIAAATVLGWGTLLHVSAVIKHVAMDRDGSLDRILLPSEGDHQSAP